MLSYSAFSYHEAAVVRAFFYFHCFTDIALQSRFLRSLWGRKKMLHNFLVHQIQCYPVLAQEKACLPFMLTFIENCIEELYAAIA